MYFPLYILRCCFIGQDRYTICTTVKCGIVTNKQPISSRSTLVISNDFLELNEIINIIINTDLEYRDVFERSTCLSVRPLLCPHCAWPLCTHCALPLVILM